MLPNCSNRRHLFTPPVNRFHLGRGITCRRNGCVKPEGSHDEMSAAITTGDDSCLTTVVANDDSFTKQASTLRKPTKMHLHSFQEHCKNLLIQCCSSAIAEDAIQYFKKSQKRAPNKKGHIFKIRLHEGILQKNPASSSPPEKPARILPDCAPQVQPQRFRQRSRRTVVHSSSRSHPTR